MVVAGVAPRLVEGARAGDQLAPRAVLVAGDTGAGGVRDREDVAAGVGVRVVDGAGLLYRDEFAGATPGVAGEEAAVAVGLPVVALLVDASLAGYRDAFRAGACGAVPFDAPVETIVAVLRAALDQHVLLPVELAQALAGGDNGQSDNWITDAEAEWLRLLKTGMTIAKLAEKVGYSERSLYRLLHDVYGRMQVSNRTEAIAKAARLGIIDA